jgi:hypothetical protein
MAQILPTLTDGTQAYSFHVDLEGITYGFDFSWNWMRSFWSVVIRDATGEALLSQTLRTGNALLARFQAREGRLPPGEIIVFDTSGQDKDPGLQDLGTRVQLIYLTAEEVIAA